MATKKKAAAAPVAITLEELNAAGTSGMPIEGRPYNSDWVSNGHAELNPDGDMIRITPAGTTALNAESEKKMADAPKFLISPKAEVKRGSGRSDKYPFAEFPAPTEDGQTAKFFVPATDNMPEPWKSLQSTISTASKRYAKPSGKTKKVAGKDRPEYDYERRFRVFRATHEGVTGAFIERVL